MGTPAPEAAAAGLVLLPGSDPPGAPGPGAGAGSPVRAQVWSGRAATVLVAAAIAALAFWVRYHLLVRSGGLGGDSGYDDGVYYAAADALVHGRLPYRDFLFLQPPGIAIVLAPFAWLGSITSDPHGVVVARIAFIALGAANAVLVAALCRRFGRAAAVVAGVAYALSYPAAYAERSMLLEPVGSAGVLLALVLTTRLRSTGAAVLGGAALGLAVATKIWYVVPLVLLLAAVRGRRRLWLLCGAAGTLLLVVGPFLLASPADLVRQVVTDQLGRPASGDWPPGRRLASMLGLGTPAVLSPQAAAVEPLKVAALVVTVVVLAALALSMPGGPLLVALTAAEMVVLLLTPSFFPHYDALLVPALMLTVGAGVGRLASLLRARPLQVALVAAGIAACVLLNRHVDTQRTSEAIPAGALRPAAARVPGCVTGDDPLVLAELNVLTRDLRRGCEVWIDVTGYTYDRDRETYAGNAVPRLLNTRWQHDITRYLLTGDAAIVHRQGTGLGWEGRRAVARGGVLARSGNWVLHAVRRP